MSVATLQGRYVWYDLMTSDPDAAQSFYTALIGWTTKLWEGPMPYTMWASDGVPLGGVMELPEEAKKAGAPPHWLAYVGTEDVDATVSMATEMGATVLVPGTDIPETGRFAVLQDPQGAVFAVYTPRGDTPDEGPPKMGEFSWHELATDDFEAAFTFYHTLFGWEKTEAMDMGEAGIYQMYGRGNGKPLGGMFNRPPQMPVNAWLFYVSIPDVHASVEKVKELGGTILNGPMEVPGGDFIAQCLDPQGAAFALHSTKK